MRAAGVLFCAAVALGIFAGIEPRCLGGPFAMMDPAVRPVWLAHVGEMKPLADIFREMPVTGAWVSAFPTAALIVMFCLLRTPLRRDFAFLTAAGALIVSAMLTLAMVKTYSYAMWFGMPLVATGVAYLFAHLKTGPARALRRSGAGNADCHFSRRDFARAGQQVQATATAGTPRMPKDRCLRAARRIGRKD